MGMVDKILLALMIFLMPLGLLVTYKLFPSQEETEQKQVELEKKIDGLMAQISAANVPVAKPVSTIQLSQVVYASESGTLKVAGAGQSGAAVMVSATVLPASKDEKDKSAVKGHQVEVFSVETNGKGVFSFEYDVGRLSEGIVEMRFEQKESVQTVRFDMAKKQQII